MEPKVLKQHFEDALAHTSNDADITFRPMFGGILAYADGKPLASLSNVGLAFKLGTKDQEELLAQKGAKRLRYEPDAPESKTYIVVPEGFLKDGKELAPWIEKSVAFVRSAPAKKKK